MQKEVNFDHVSMLIGVVVSNLIGVLIGAINEKVIVVDYWIVYHFIDYLHEVRVTMND